jgi:protein-S-isoprenylcysteine O-methyltransferase Ste14
MISIRWLEHRIPPPVAAGVFAGAIWGIAQLGPLPDISPSIRVAIAATVAFIGGAFNVAGMMTFQRARATMNPMAPEKASALVTTGVYRITCNPMYVGGAILLIAWAVYLSSVWALLGPPLFVLYITKLQILPEERALSAIFSSSFDAYHAKVRRWL